MIRLDAAGYAIKPGTSCFMIDETYEFISKLTKKQKQKELKCWLKFIPIIKRKLKLQKE